MNTRNEAQIEYWNDKAGEKWATEADQLDALLSPFIDDVLAPVSGAENILDVGCGTGALSRAAAASGARVTGVDVSVPMLAVARERAKAPGAAMNVVKADASAFTSDMPFDALISRFGVMFFDDPVAGFMNLRKQMARDAQLSFACWRAMTENDWVVAALKTAMKFLTTPPEPPEPGGPGPFAFADKAYVTQLLKSAGWSNVKVTPWDGMLAMPGTNTMQTAAFMLKIGPLARLIAEQDIDEEKLQAALADDLESQRSDDGRVQLKAAAWIVTGKA